jgi:broad specificity phosphatase PhoE/predicted kinase
VPVQQLHSEKIALVMVGLPASGKTYIALKIARYLSWLGQRVRVFNVGEYRRERLGGRQDAEFFSPDNAEGFATRMALANAALDDMLTWLSVRGDVAIYDATNADRARRDMVFSRCHERGVQVIFIESICDELVVEQNIRDTKLHSPDYVGWDPERAVNDFRARIAHYKRAYEPIEDPSKSYVKIIDVGRQFVVNRMEGYLSARLIFFLMNVHAGRRPIWLTRHGESEFNVAGRLGGDTPLTAAGRAYAGRLARFIAGRSHNANDVTVWTSMLQRTVDTAGALGVPTLTWRALDEIDAGNYEGLTYDEVREQHPAEFAARADDKFRYRYPRGESYADLVVRLETVIVELERQRSPVLVVAHQAVLRVLYAYLMGTAQDTCPYLSIPLHTVIELKPNAYGYAETRFPLG